ncbi:MAG: efflux RND transporter periplasmic adaptor subunit [Rikenellaceae bacterium]
MKQLYLLSPLFLIISCGRVSSTTSEVRPVKSTIALEATYIDKDFVGMASPANAVNLAFKVSGQILDTPVSTGQRVSKGELLADLDPRDFELTVEADKSTYEQASSRLNRTERLLEREAVSRQEYENALSSYVQAKSAYENSKEVLNQTSLRAPFAAVVEKIYVDPFERVQSGQTILRIVDPLTDEVKFTIPESSLSALSMPSTRFSVRFDNYRDVSFSARLVDYAITTSNAAGFPVKIVIQNPDSSLYPISPGFSCTVTIQSEDPSQGAISLPLSAIYAPAQGGTYVWIIGDDNRVELRAVTLGDLYSSDRVIITSGVRSGERVVVAGVYQLQDGSKVKLISQK